MKINRLILGPLETNCYIITNNDKCIIIDPADSYDLIKKEIKNKQVVGVFVTHFHFDHVQALDNFNQNLIFSKDNLEEKEYNLFGFNFEVIYTLGHTSDSITLYFKDLNAMFDGDFIFKDGIGRTDLGGNELDMISSIKKLKKYDKNIVLYPGHGDSTILWLECDKYVI